MKKLIAAILSALFILPLLCCGGKPQDANAPQNAGTAEPAGSGTAEPAGAETAEPTGTETAKPQGAPLTYEEVYDPDTDFNNFFGGSPTIRMLETEDAYMFAGGGNYLCYYDKATGESDVLCGKPECEHDYIAKNKSCSGYVGLRTPCEICMYKGQIYFIQENNLKLDLYRMNPDTSGREKLFTLGYGDDSDESRRLYFPQFMAIHRGKMYGWNSETFVEAGEPMHAWAIACWDLETGEFSVVHEEKSEGMPSLFFFGKYIYFANEERTTELTEDYEEILIDETITVRRYDTETGEIATVINKTIGPESFISRTSICVLAEDKVYLVGADYTAGQSTVYNVAAGEIEAVMTLETDGTLSLLQNCMACYSRRYDLVQQDPNLPMHIAVWDYDGNKLFDGQVPLDTVFGLDERVQKNRVGSFGFFSDGEALFMALDMRLSGEISDYERETEEFSCLIRYELVDGELRETLLCVCKWND